MEDKQFNQLHNDLLNIAQALKDLKQALACVQVRSQTLNRIENLLATIAKQQTPPQA